MSDTEETRVRHRRLRRALIWIGAIGMPFAFPIGLWLSNQGAIHTDRFLLIYWVCALIWAGSFTHWMWNIPEVIPRAE